MKPAISQAQSASAMATFLLPSLFSPKSHSLSFRAHALSSASSPTPPTAVIVGGGLAGLAAAVHLHSAAIPFLLLEASDAVGGRVRTDSVDGFLLDRGFQIFLTAYPEARRLLDYPSLDLRPFYPGALVYHDGRFHRVADPFRRPIDGLAGISSPIGTLTDKLLVGLTRLFAAARSDTDLLSAAETSISDRLISTGFSPSIVSRFFHPFLAGIFFDPDLATTSRLYDFIFKCLAIGDNTLPAGGIAAIPQQLAGKLPRESIRLHSRVSAVESGCVRLAGGEVVAGELGVIVAVEQPEAALLLPGVAPDTEPGVAPDTEVNRNRNRNRNRSVRSTVCIYFAADRAVVREPILILNGTGHGVVNNMFFATSVVPELAPVGKVLVSVSLIGEYREQSDGDLLAEVLQELGGWFGEEEVGMWRYLRMYRIGFTQPVQIPPTELVGKEPRVGEGVYVCGDHWSSATFDGALSSGRRAAEALISDRRV